MEAREEPDILDDQRPMQCLDWAHAQDADPVIKRLKVLMNECCNNAQLNSELAEAKPVPALESAKACEWSCNAGVERSDWSIDLRPSSASEYAR